VWAALVALSAVLLTCAAWFAWSLPATASRRTRASAALAERSDFWAWLFEHAAPPSSPGWLAASLLLASATGFGAWVGIVALLWERGGRAVVALVVGVTAAAAGIGVLALPNQTTDIYDYALFGRVVAVHGGEAYHDVPDQYPDDPLQPYASHRYTARPDNKLPVWTATAVGVSAVAGDDPVHGLVAFRLLLAGAVVATTALLARTAERVHRRAGASAAAAFGLCPVTFVYGASKTDALMALLLVAGLALAVEGRDRSATFLVTLSVLVKLITLPVLVLLVALPPIRHLVRGSPPLTAPVRWRASAERAAIALATVVVAYAPLRDPLALARTHLTGTSQGSVLPVAHVAAGVAFGLVLATMAVVTWRSHGTGSAAVTTAFLDRAAVLLVVFAVLLTRPGLPWYVLSALAVVALCRSATLFGVLAVLSGASFAMGLWDSVGTRAHPLPPLAPPRPVTYLGMGVLAIALAVLHHHRHGRRSTGPSPAATSAGGLLIGHPSSWRTPHADPGTARRSPRPPDPRPATPGADRRDDRSRSPR
jgi:hypothetical protein